MKKGKRENNAPRSGDHARGNLSSPVSKNPRAAVLEQNQTLRLGGRHNAHASLHHLGQHDARDDESRGLLAAIGIMINDWRSVCFAGASAIGVNAKGPRLPVFVEKQRVSFSG